jgi:hypothetical protein
MNDTPKPNPLRAAAIYGLYIGLFLSLCDLIPYVTGGRPDFLTLPIKPIKLIGSIGILVYGMKRYRDIDNGGYISYGGAFSFGILTSVFSTVLGVACNFVMFMSNAEAIKDRLYLTVNDYADKGLIPDEAIADIAPLFENIVWIMPLFRTIWGMLFGLVYSLIISAAIVRKRPIFES